MVASPCLSRGCWARRFVPAIQFQSVALTIFVSSIAGLSGVAFGQDLQSIAEPSSPTESLELRLRETETRLKQLEASVLGAKSSFATIDEPSQGWSSPDVSDDTSDPYFYTSSLQEDKKSKTQDGDSSEKKGDKSDEKKDEKKSDKKSEKKKWFEKYTIRGYAQFRFNETMNFREGSFPSYLQGDSSVGDNQSFLLRRARLIISGDVNEHLGIYLQPDFAASVPGVGDQIQYVQIRDWYSDLYLETTKVHRLRIGQSKVPYGWENMQSSSNRLALDRNDAFNSAVRNERELGVFYYWTPKPAQDFFKYTVDEGLKGSGNYGVFGLGVYNGQGGSFREQNDNLHVVARLTLPGQLPGGQLYELGMQGYTGDYNVLTSPISPLGTGGVINPFSKPTGYSDERLGWSAIYYPQPLGFQAEWTIGTGPTLNERQNAIEEGSIKGGYIQSMYQYKSNYGTFIPFVRYQHFRGGYKTERNAPFASIDDYELGMEWQINSAAELTTMYTFTDRTNTVARSQANTLSYGQFAGDILRFQLQFNY